MKIYALVGESGTGKSHRAARIAREKNIEYIVSAAATAGTRRPFS